MKKQNDTTTAVFNSLSKLTFGGGVRGDLTDQWCGQTEAFMTWFDNKATNSGLSGYEYGLKTGYTLPITPTMTLDPYIGIKFSLLHTGKINGISGSMTRAISGVSYNFGATLETAIK